jgi:photosystem II stability/assembly factor-like uncharacterized protein
MLARITITALFTLALAGQDVPKQDAQEAPAKASPIFEYDGKPITIPYHCSLDDIKWAGMTCSEDEACPMYLELASADAVGDHVFAAGNIHSDAVTLYSVLLTSGDGGHTWQMGPDSVRGAGLDHMQFLDALTGWISGQTLFPIPQDPFLLQTTDGGKTWSLKPIFTENHFGSIQQFTFDSKTSGAVVVDNGPGGDTERYTRLESSDGGSTWMLKEENRKSIPLKRAAAASTWRVRADASTRSYRIEHKTGNQWTAVAAFAVKLPACKPE